MRCALLLLVLPCATSACSGSDERPDGAGGSSSITSTTPAGTATGTSSSIGGAGGTISTGSGGSGASGAGGAAGTLGCGNDQAPTGLLQQSVEVAGTTRTYLVSVPASYDPNTPWPVVFAWHGRFGSGAQARTYFGVEEQAAGAALFVYPDGLEVVGGGTGWELTANGYDVAFFDAMLEGLRQTHCIDEGRIFSTGHSYGGYFSNTLGCARAAQLGAIAPVSGGGPFAAACTGPVSAWIAHGSSDLIVDVSQGEGSRDHWVAQDGCDSASTPTEPSPCVAYSSCSSGEAVHWCLHGGGHEWPSFAPAAIWSFFAAAP